MSKFQMFYPGQWTEREKPYVTEYQAKIKELEDRGPIDVQALISGKIEKGTQGFMNVLAVKEDMMLYNAKKYDPDNKLYTDDAYAKQFGYAGKIAMPTFGAHDDSFLTAFNGAARDILCVSGLNHSVTQLAPVYAGDTLYMVKDKLEMYDLTPPEGSEYRNLYLRCSGTVYNQKGEAVLNCSFSARENLKSWANDADKDPSVKPWESPDWWTRPEHYYTDEDWQYIFDIWAKENPRGENPLYWEDVNIGDMPNTTIDGPIEASCMPTPPYGMAVSGSRTMKELADPAVRNAMRRDEKTGIYYPADEKQLIPEVPPYDDPRKDMPPMPVDPDAPKPEPKRAIFINFLGRDFAIRHINNWMGSNGWLKNIRWGIMTDPVEQGYHFPKNPHVPDFFAKIPGMENKKSTSHGLQHDVMQIKSKVYDKYVSDSGEHLVELGWWIETIDGVIYEEGGATVKLPSKED